MIGSSSPRASRAVEKVLLAVLNASVPQAAVAGRIVVAASPALIAQIGRDPTGDPLEVPGGSRRSEGVLTIVTWLVLARAR